jgi:S1-C subfamily serine protease
MITVTDGTDRNQFDDRSDSVNIQTSPRERVDMKGQTPLVQALKDASDQPSRIATADVIGRVADTGPEPEPASVGERSRLHRLRRWSSTSTRILGSGRPRTVALLGAGLLLVASTTGFLTHEDASVRDELHATNQRQASQIASLHSELVGGMGATTDRIIRLERAADGQLDTAAVARDVAPSVYEVDAGDFVGTAWVAASSGGTAELVTNAHVVADLVDAGQGSVTLVRGADRIPATIGRVDRDADLAVLSTDRSLPVLRRAAGDVTVGDQLMVVGSALGLEGSVSSGIVSAVRTEDAHTYIQLSAPVNFGNSGGPVVDRHGQVVGVTVAKAIADGAEGVAFAIPISTVCRTVLSCEPPRGRAQGPLRPS